MKMFFNLELSVGTEITDDISPMDQKPFFKSNVGSLNTIFYVNSLF